MLVREGICSGIAATLEKDKGMENALHLNCGVKDSVNISVILPKVFIVKHHSSFYFIYML